VTVRGGDGVREREGERERERERGRERERKRERQRGSWLKLVFAKFSRALINFKF
jgi:hypothetical protein